MSKSYLNLLKKYYFPADYPDPCSIYELLVLTSVSNILDFPNNVYKNAVTPHIK